MNLPTDQTFMQLTNYKEISDLHQNLKQSLNHKDYSTTKRIILQIQQIISPSSSCFTQLQLLIKQLPLSSEKRLKLSQNSQNINQNQSSVRNIQARKFQQNSVLTKIADRYTSPKKIDDDDINIEELKKQVIYKIQNQNQSRYTNYQPNPYQNYALQNQQSLQNQSNNYLQYDELEDDNDRFATPPIQHFPNNSIIQNQTLNEVQKEKQIRFSIEKDDLYFKTTDIKTINKKTDKIDIQFIDYNEFDNGYQNHQKRSEPSYLDDDSYRIDNHQPEPQQTHHNYQLDNYQLDQLISPNFNSISESPSEENYPDFIQQIPQEDINSTNNNKQNNINLNEIPHLELENFDLLNPLIYADEVYSKLPFTFVDYDILKKTIENYDLWDKVQKIYQKFIQDSDLAKQLVEILYSADVKIKIIDDYSRCEIRGIFNLAKIYFSKINVQVQKLLKKYSGKLGIIVAFGDTKIDAGDLVGLFSLIRVMQL